MNCVFLFIYNPILCASTGLCELRDACSRLRIIIYDFGIVHPATGACALLIFPQAHAMANGFVPSLPEPHQFPFE